MARSTRTRPLPLLCELHAHSTWSDGLLSVRELAELYGAIGFDVLAVTDHALAPSSAARANRRTPWVTPDDYERYLADLDAEAKRAWRRHRLLLLPGLELTFGEEDPDRSAHVVAVGLHEPVDLDAGLERALAAARNAGAALIAAHPHGAECDLTPHRTTRRFWREPALHPLIDRFELFNRYNLFGWVAEAGLPIVATGDFHRLEHLAGWKTLLPCAQDEAAVVEHLRSDSPVYLTRIRDAVNPLVRTAA